MRTCRMCSGKLEEVLDLGVQCLSGQFPAANAPDPPRYPLVFCRCHSCGLAQLSETVPPDLMYRDYWYQSGVTQTMRSHLRNVAEEARGLCDPSSVFDIGCNDGTFLHYFLCNRVGLDPMRDFGNFDGANFFRGYYPERRPDIKFDLITTLACFYDVDDPVGFMRAIHDQLMPDGLWCVEVADLSVMLERGTFDGICHEHLTYWTVDMLLECANRSRLKMIQQRKSEINGGSIRCYIARKESARWPSNGLVYYWEPLNYQNFVRKVEEVRNYARIETEWNVMHSQRGGNHLLGASTKSNTILQYCGIDHRHIPYASDRDLRKVGRVTPGTRIPIISEEQSRAMNPDAYLCFLHNTNEVRSRETEIPIIFPFEESKCLQPQT